MSLKSIIRSIVYKPKHILDLARLKSAVRNSSGAINIIIGAHNTHYEGWLQTNIESLDLLSEASFQALFGNRKADRFLAEHVFEHLTFEQGVTALKHCFQYLKPGGTVRIAVPDGYHPNPDYIHMVKPGGSGEGAHDHKLIYNYRKLSDAFRAAGFSPVLLEYYDEQGKFHYQDWDSRDGHIIRSRRYDKRFNSPLGYSSLIIDGVKS